MYDQLYKMNVECDFLWPESENLEDYDLLVVPALYAASEELLNRIHRYVEEGGHLFTTFKTAFTNENLKVYSDCQPYILNQCLGISYSHFTIPKNVKLTCEKFSWESNEVKNFMELLIPEGAQVLASYDHYNWKKYAAVTRNRYGKGSATYLGCWVSDEMLREILANTLEEAGIERKNLEIEFPVIIKRGMNDFGKEITYYMNYSSEIQKVRYLGETAVDLIEDSIVESEQVLEIAPWDLKILESKEAKVKKA